ncbi:MAG TPA: Rrf2 family transcriptional regulator [Candidatus Polarisedimenticolaceae bacterium]|nr:Rrf2 family transcriptional regulator [Candidatus Polarisedimenticolaceae bacterium]
MISRASRYALSVLRSLGQAEDERLSTAALADETGVPPSYLAKLLTQLRKQGVVDAERGWGGGFRLRPEALDRPLRDIVVIFDGRERSADKACLLELTDCDEDNPCVLHPFWRQIRQALDELLTTQTIRDLAMTRTRDSLRERRRGPDEGRRS